MSLDHVKCPRCNNSFRFYEEIANNLCAVCVSEITKGFRVVPDAEYKEMQEKVTQYDSLAKEVDEMMSKDMLGHITEWKEKADKWDNEGAFQEIKKAAEKWWGIQELLEVVEKCSKQFEAFESPSLKGKHPSVCICHGTGEIVRPVTVSEVREFIEIFNVNLYSQWVDRCETLKRRVGFKLANGGILRWKS